jgi:integrase/recombinase XerD
MGLRLRGDSWYLRKVVAGKRHEVPLGVYGGETNRRKALKAAEKMATELDQAHAATKALRRFGLEPPKKVVDGEQTFAGWWAKYEKTYLPQKSQTTQRRDREVLKHWLPILGSMRMTEIRQMHCLAGLNTRRKATTANPKRQVKTTLSEGTVQRERRLLQAIFERAVENDVIGKNPWRGIKGVADIARNRLLTTEDEAKLIAALQIPRKDAVGRLVRMDERWVRFVRFLLETGLRLEEVRGINPRTDITDGYVKVTGKFKKTREVPLTTAAKKLLKDQVKADGELWTQNPQRFREVLATAAKRAELRDPETGGAMTLSPHDLRHTFGWRWMAKGGDIYTLSKILGHASVAVTEKHYAKLLRENIADKMMAVMEPRTLRAVRGGSA